jgi:hypothetical protein
LLGGSREGAARCARAARRGGAHDRAAVPLEALVDSGDGVAASDQVGIAGLGSHRLLAALQGLAGGVDKLGPTQASLDGAGAEEGGDR